MTTPADIIRSRATAVVDGVRGDEVGAYRWIKQLVATTIKEYRGRFLHELIQNGYDAHTEGTRDGRIAVHFEDGEGEHGVLYVANGGRPLSESNFVRMASLGDSDKPIGVGIGNKGVGFKSVFQICDVPEVYSATDRDDPGFSGFSFRFGAPTDLDEYLSPNDPLRAKLERELSLSLLTVPLEATPPVVDSFREEGYVTVLRLPASNARAAIEIRERIDRLLASKAPIMLFLDRLKTLSIQTSSKAPRTSLSRHQEPEGDLIRVILNKRKVGVSVIGALPFMEEVPASAEKTCYLMLEGVIAHADLLSALQEAVDEGALDERWLDWSAEAKVSVAVGDGWAIQDPAPFTFLPMGEAATSPLGAHINAPFVTDFARLGLDIEQPVNRLMLHRIAEVCVEAADSLIAARTSAGAVVDLLAWNRGSLQWIGDAVQTLRGRSLEEFIQLPTIGRDDWANLANVAAWPDVSCTVITVERLVMSADALLLDSAQVDAGRVSRLAGVTTRDTDSLAPSPDDVAAWIEKVAAEVRTAELDLNQWRAFYDDLAILFSSGEPLYGRRIILTDTGDLVPADQPPSSAGGTRGGSRRQRAVFFAPKTAGTEDDDAVDTDIDISPPASLDKRIVFLHRDLDWYDGPQQTPGRKFLQDQRLARQFRTASLLSHLGQVMSGNPSDTLKRDSLDFAFRLFATNPTKHSKELADVGLAVPVVAGGWRDAPGARFSKGWDVPGADDLSELVAGAPDSSSEVAQLADRLIADPSVVGGANPNVAKWESFLKVLGVTATLPINEAVESRRFHGRLLTAETLAGDDAPASVPAGVVQQWASGITTAGNVNHPYTNFSTRSPVYWLAGQHEVGELSARLRRAYARLVVLTVPSLKDNHFRSTWSRDSGGGIATHVETPLWSFLTLSEWVPVAIPTEALRQFQPPFETWYVGVEDTMAAAYSPLIEPPLRTLMSLDLGGERYRKQLGFLDWSEPVDAASLVDHLTALFSRGDIPETANEHLRTSLSAAWAAIGDPAVETRPALDDALLVERAGQLAVIRKDQSFPGRLYLTGTHDQSATARLVRELGWPVVTVETSDSSRLNEVADVLRAHWHHDVEVTSEWDLDVLSDGSPWQPSEAEPRLVDEVQWLPLLIAASMRYPRASGRVGRQQLVRALDQLGRIRLTRAHNVAIASAGGDQPLPPRLRGVLPMSGDVPTLLAEATDSPPTWEQLESLTQSVLELLGQERFKAEVSLTIRDLSTEPDHAISRPTNAEIAEVLQVSEGQIGEVESAVYGAVAGIVARLRIVAPALWGEAAVEPFSETLAATYSRDDILHVLSNLAGDEKEAHSVLAASADTSDGNALRRRLGIALSDFNASLARYFPTDALVDNGAEQREEFDLRRRQRHHELVDWARQLRIGCFDAGEAQSDWVAVRELTFLEADPGWATTLDEVGQDRLDARIDDQMTDALGVRPQASESLPDYNDIRAANGRPIRTRLIEASHVVTAWCAQNNAAVPEAWSEEIFDSSLRRRLEHIGALDFRVLTDGDLARWLSLLGAWPDGMTLSVAISAHGLTMDDLHAQGSAEAAAKAEKARASKRVKFQGTDIDLDASMSTLVDQVADFLATDPTSLESAYRTSSLDQIARRKPQDGDRDPGKGEPSGGVVSRRLSNEQTSAIGLVGEMVAFHWLRNRDPSGVVDQSCWKSGNCRFVIEGATGNDSLGYDFEVPRRGGRVMYEVKATTGDAGMIELGETEVRCAQQHSRNDRWRLLIVEDVLSPAPRIHMLPNPFHHDSRSLFSFDGNSVRLRFSLG